MPLFVVPTPIGNLGDITIRAIRVLREADIIACEDTRKTAILLQHYHIRVPTISYYAHNEYKRGEQLLERLRKGQQVALVSDAGTPGISDPGAILIRAALSENILVDVLPGPTAFVPALIQSGLGPHPFTFYGFLPDKAGERQKELALLKDHPFPIIIYLSPHKAQKHLRDILKFFGDRPAALVREISKIYQEARRSSLSLLLKGIEEEGVRGELVLIVDRALSAPLDESIWQGKALDMLRDGITSKEVVEFIIQHYSVSKNTVKDWLIHRGQD
ncbi:MULTISPECIES: 16S rRNA (cytidine(1402)-2'-O)-methyltransferase [Aminobacterium]|jgi:16S rRNA (cytidine1402-2'-O)-methyltransferase|uniref:16S rRNA (cytidine(1402)-2'-O)-methyltransferase n=1 Tax=Aminobacterium TaxID=81466 RepID=UPI00257DE3C9|nr:MULTISPECIES: 16S rRNA (cytidine(1402)-2'-O)-methyltransferase [unclassified Aminobacterium]